MNWTWLLIIPLIPIVFILFMGVIALLVFLGGIIVHIFLDLVNWVKKKC